MCVNSLIFIEQLICPISRTTNLDFLAKVNSLSSPPDHLDPGCAIFVRDFFRWSVFGIMTKLMGSPKTHGVTGHVGIQEF